MIEEYSFEQIAIKNDILFACYAYYGISFFFIVVVVFIVKIEEIK